jgi:hypothetical protein
MTYTDPSTPEHWEERAETQMRYAAEAEARAERASKSTKSRYLLMASQHRVDAARLLLEAEIVRHANVAASS